MTTIDADLACDDKRMVQYRFDIRRCCFQSTSCNTQRSVAVGGKGKGGGDAKTAKTIVRVLRKDTSGGGSALVMCQPVTGRTHQIRLHLQVRGAEFGRAGLKRFRVLSSDAFFRQHVGHPVANDPLYLMAGNEEEEPLGAASASEEVEAAAASAAAAAAASLPSKRPRAGSRSSSAPAFETDALLNLEER